jgi:hypothetical protein
VLHGVTLEGNFHALRHKALAAFLTAAAQNVATGLAGHTGTKAELIFAGALGWLIGALAHDYDLDKGSVSARKAAWGAKSRLKSPVVNPPVAGNYKSIDFS